DGLMSHDNASFARLHCFIWPEIAAANAGTSDSDECVCRVDNACLGHVVDPNITGLIHNSCFHDLITGEDAANATLGLRLTLFFLFLSCFRRVLQQIRCPFGNAWYIFNIALWRQIFAWL